MPLFQTPLVSLINKRLEYLSKRSQVLTENISRADIIGAKRKDLRPFEKILEHNKLSKTDSNSRFSKPISSKDVVSYSQEIEKEMEVLEMSHNAINQQAIIDILNVVKKLLKTATSRA